MRLHAVQNAENGDLATLRDAAREGRAAAMQRRRQLSQGKQALNSGGDRTAGAADAGPPALIVHRGGGR